MIKFMDEIVEAVEQFIEGVGENALIILGILEKIVIFITTPVWILPYIAIRRALEWRENYSYAKKVAKMGEYAIAGFKAGLESVEKPKCESPDCDSCPFLPCGKGEGGHD